MTRTTRPRTARSSSRRNTSNGSSAAVITRPAVPTVTSKPNTAALVEHKPIELPIAHDQIAAAAYKLWQQRGGSAEQNWLDAEAQLRKQAEVRR